MIGKAAQRASRRAREALEPHGVTPTQYASLRVLSDADGQTGADLGMRFAIDSAMTASPTGWRRPVCSTGGLIRGIAV